MPYETENETDDEETVPKKKDRFFSDSSDNQFSLDYQNLLCRLIVLFNIDFTLIFTQILW